MTHVRIPDAPAAIPVLLYHAVGTSTSTWIAPYTVSREVFMRHLALIAESGRTPMCVADLLLCATAEVPLPPRAVLVTFDDGFADNADVAAPLLAAAGIRATIFLTTGFLDSRSPGGDRMLSWSAAAELAAAGHEIGAHSVTHPQLDTLGLDAARYEIMTCRQQLEDRLDLPIRSFAYPHGYSSPRIRRMVKESGYESACAVRNALSHAQDATFSLARLTVTADTDDRTVASWLAGRGATLAAPSERVATRAWRAYRRAAARVDGVRTRRGAT